MPFVTFASFDPFLFLRYTQVRQLRRDVLSRSRRLHGFVDVQDLAVRTDVERPSVGEAHAAQHPVCFRDLFRRVGEDRIVRVDVLGEFLVGLRVVDADREVGDVELPNRGAALPERLAFGRSSAGEGFRKPCEDDGALALEVGELMGPPI